jgi:hypothetical protein
VTAIIGPLRHSIQPRTRTRLPASPLTSIPARERRNVLAVDADGDVAEVEIDVPG